MKKIIFTLLMGNFFFFALAQQKTLKTFLGVEYIHNKTITFINGFKDSTDYKRFGLINPVFAHSKMKPSGKRFREWQVSDLTLEKEDDIRLVSSMNPSIPIAGAKKFRTSAAVAYTENFLWSDKDDRFQFWIGAGLQMFVEYNLYRPKTSILFPKCSFCSSLSILAMPRATYKINQKFMLDFHIPLIINKINICRSREENPVISVFNQRKTDFSYIWKPSLSEVRLGLPMYF
jgi:hypothetical protein